MEGMRFGEPDRHSDIGREGRENPEVARLKAAIERIISTRIGEPGLPPTRSERLRQLEMILEAEPQRDKSGALRYLLTSGLAVELTTGFQRHHHDIDLVIMEGDKKYWDIIGTDNVTPGHYWADMQFSPEFLEETAREVTTRRGGNSPGVEVVHPAVIMVQKASNAFGRPPRTSDKLDVNALIKYWKTHEEYSEQWYPVIEQSLEALPGEEYSRTYNRLNGFINATG